MRSLSTLPPTPLGLVAAAAGLFVQLALLAPSPEAHAGSVASPFAAAPPSASGRVGPLAVKALYDPLSFKLSVAGDGQANSTTVSRTAAGEILVNAGTLPIAGGTPTVANTSRIGMSGKGGDDALAFDETNGALPAGELSGGGGDDTLTGGSGVDKLMGQGDTDSLFGKRGNDELQGGPGDDVLTGGPGDDNLLGGPGNDTFVWVPGDNSDTIEGQDGFDVLEFTGSPVSERIVLSAFGSRLRLTRDIAAVTLDMAGVEQARLLLLGGADAVTIGELAGTSLAQLRIDGAGLSGGTSGDGQVDTLTIEATPGDDSLTLTLVNGQLLINGLSVEITLDHFEPIDEIRINGGTGNDKIDASLMPSNGPRLVLSGGAGDDVLLGGAGGDVLDGGDGHDVLVGGLGADILLNGEVAVQLSQSLAPGAEAGHCGWRMQGRSGC